MHPSEVRLHVIEAVDELRARIVNVDLGITGITLDKEQLVLSIRFDHHELETTTAVERSPLHLAGGQQRARTVRVPLIGGSHTTRPLVLRMGLDAFDLKPPTAELLDVDGNRLPRGEWPGSFDQRGIVDDHPRYGRPFFCRRGLREYHEHPQHEEDPWTKYRNGLPLHAIVIELLTELRVRWHGAA